MRVVTKADAGQWIKATNAYEKIMAKAATKAMRDVGKAAVLKGRQAITSAGFSTAFARSLVALNKPPTGYVLNPRVYIHSTINYADVFEKGATISGGRGRSASPYLWLPFDNVPSNPGSGVKFGGLVHRQHMTPSQYVRKVGPLISIQRKGKLPLLAAVVEGPDTRPSRGRLRATFLKRRFGEKTRKTHLVFLFYAVRQITIPQKFDTHAAMEGELDQLNELYNNSENHDRYEGRE